MRRTFTEVVEGLFKPINKYSIQNLRYGQTRIVSVILHRKLNERLEKNPNIQPDNEEIVSESLRAIVELIIWSEQNGANFFDYFVEHDILSYLLRAVIAPIQRRTRLQLLQVLNILVENLQNEMSIYYILKSEDLNDAIRAGADGTDDEEVSYYISLMRSLSMRLRDSTIEFFYNERRNDMPLFTESVKFFAHSESMVRIAVRTLTLNIFRVSDGNLLTYLGQASQPYFAAFSRAVGSQCYRLQNMIASHATRRQLDDAVEDISDSLYYMHEICSLGKMDITRSLNDAVLQHLFNPLLVSGVSNEPTGRSGQSLKPLTSVFLLAHAFAVLRYAPTINTLAAALLLPAATSLPAHILPAETLSDVLREYNEHKGTLSPSSPRPKQCELHQQVDEDWTHSRAPSRNVYRDALFAFMTGEDDQLRVVTVALVAALLANPCTDPHLLETAGLVPARVKQHRALLSELMGSDPMENVSKPRLSMSDDSLFGDDSPLPRTSTHTEVAISKHGMELIDVLFCVIAQRPFTLPIAVSLAGNTLASLLEPASLGIDVRAVVRKEYIIARDDVVTAASGPIASWIPHLMDLCVAREPVTMKSVLHNASMLAPPERVIPDMLKNEPTEIVYQAIDAVERFVALRRVCSSLSGLDIPAFPSPAPSPRPGAHVVLPSISLKCKCFKVDSYIAVDVGVCLILQQRGEESSHAVVTYVLPLNTLQITVVVSDGPKLALKSGRVSVDVVFETHDDCRQCADALAAAITDFSMLETQRLGALLADRCPLPRKYKELNHFTPTVETPTTMKNDKRHMALAVQETADVAEVGRSREVSSAKPPRSPLMSPLRPSEVSPLQAPTSPSEE